MPSFKTITVDQPDPAAWRYVVTIEDGAGERFRFTADAEQLDIICAALDERLDAMVEAATRHSTTA